MVLDFLNNSPPREYWDKQVVLFRGGAPFIADLPDAQELVRVLSGAFADGDWIEPIDVRINASRISDDGSSQQLLTVGIEQARKLFKSGFSLCFGDLSDDIPSVHELKLMASEFFRYLDLVSVTGYLSPLNAVGVLHFDRQHNFFIQREGSKRWFVSERAAIVNPYENLVYSGTPQKFFDNLSQRGYEILMPRDCGRVVYDLVPGDVLYIPPGFYHSPETTTKVSLHYTLTVEPACIWKDFNNRLFEVMLANNRFFFKDYRFMEEDEKVKLFEKCSRLIYQMDLRD
jgi:hypothetical protein